MNINNLILLELISTCILLYVIICPNSIYLRNSKIIYCVKDIIIAITLFTMLSNQNIDYHNTISIALVWLVFNYVLNLNNNNYILVSFNGFVLGLILSDLEKNLRLVQSVNI